MLLPWLAQPAEVAKRIDSITCSTIEEAIDSESCCIAVIAIQSKDSAVRILTILIGEVVLFFNVGKSMGPAQIKGTIDMILVDHVLKNLKPEDWKVLFHDMKRGIYGQLYDRLDGQIIFENAHKYADKRQSIYENRNIALKNQLNSKESDDFKNIDPEIIKVLSKVKTEIHVEEKKNFSKDLVAPKFKEPDEKTKFIQSCFREFDDLHKKNPVETASVGRFIKYNDKIVDQVDFVKIKLKEEEDAV